MTTAPFNRFTAQQRAELKALAVLSDDHIDTSDAPEILDWSSPKRGFFYRLVKPSNPDPSIQS